MLGPILVIVALLLGASALITAGVYLLFGVAWAMVAAGAFMFLAAYGLRQGLTSNG